MITYHKIQTVFLRDPATNYKRLMEGAWSKPEFEYLRKCPWLVDEKIDGTNIRMMWDGYESKIGGKTDSAQLHVDLIDNIRALISDEKLGEVFGTKSAALLQEPMSVCLYGEGYGAGIQKGGGLYRPTKGFILFDVKVGEMWLERHNVNDIAEKLGFDVVPQLGVMTLEDAIELTKKGFDSTFGKFRAEGIIARPLVEMKNRFGERIITKLKCTDYEYEIPGKE